MFEHHQANPTKHQIERDSNSIPRRCEQQLSRRTKQGKQPHRAQQAEAGDAADLDSGERRVGAGNLEKDGGVIQSLQDARPARSRDYVIGGGAYEHSEHAGTVNRQIRRRGER